MNLNKSRDFFDPDMLGNASCHIIGCGAIGSTVAENLARIGVTNFHLWDFDIVNPHNIANQMFFDDQIKHQKVGAIADTLQRINPLVKITRHLAYEKQNLSGYVFLCVDNIDLRRRIVQLHLNNPNIKAIFDFRMRLTDAQHYAAPWDNEKEKQILLDSMQFSHEEATAATPVSACGIPLSVAPTVRIIAAYGVSNFINYVLTGDIKRLILIDAFKFAIDAF